MNMNKIKILFFAAIRDKAGTKSMDLYIPNEMTVHGLKEKLGTEYPNLKDSLKSVLVSVNQEYSFDDAVIPSNAEVALFPPVSGG
jgi:molybdopterin synthase catalytic subunit